MVQADRLHVTIGRMSIAYRMIKATNRCSEYVILNAFPRQQYLHERV
jgi:hypothetical protein